MSGLLKRKKKAAPVAEAPVAEAPVAEAPVAATTPTPAPAPKPSKSFIAEKKREERAECEEARVEAEEMSERERLAKRKRFLSSVRCAGLVFFFAFQVDNPGGRDRAPA